MGFFEGCSCEAITDQPDLRAYLNCCDSLKVETGCWMVYEYPNYIGYQYLLRKGEYPDSQHWTGFSDSIRSCCIITAVSFPYCLHIYNRNYFGGRILEFIGNCSSLQVDFHYRDIQSCNTLEESWGSMTAKVGNFQPMWIFPNQHFPKLYVNKQCH
uniref:Beta/gamma crystallin 'Greek key' domain-containing protein n=1 Tax=Falco tinnunculus TaxID=100819 RepID=A0A8C4XQY1_FALTI